MHKRDSFKTEEIGQSAAKPRIEESSSTKPEMAVEASASKWRASKLSYDNMMNDIVSAYAKA